MGTKGKRRRIEHERFTAVIGDVIGSRRFTRAERTTIQERLTAQLTSWNDAHGDAVASKFLVTLGDEFQGLLSDPTVIPDLLWDLRTFSETEIRLGIGYGEVFTPVQEYALGSDGPAWHKARESLLLARKDKRLGGVFEGFDRYDDVLNGLGRLMEFIRHGLTDRQSEVFNLLRSGQTQADVARELNLSRQTVSQHAAAGWTAYEEGEKGLRGLLTLLQA